MRSIQDGLNFLFILLKDFIYFFLERGESREKERGRCVDVREISCLLHTSIWGPGPQPRHVP